MKINQLVKEAYLHGQSYGLEDGYGGEPHDDEVEYDYGGDSETDRVFDLDRDTFNKVLKISYKKYYEKGLQKYIEETTCSDCGQRLDGYEEEVECSNCEALYDEAHPTCPNCYTSISNFTDFDDEEMLCPDCEYSISKEIYKWKLDAASIARLKINQKAA